MLELLQFTLTQIIFDTLSELRGVSNWVVITVWMCLLRVCKAVSTMTDSPEKSFLLAWAGVASTTGHTYVTLSLSTWKLLSCLMLRVVFSGFSCVAWTYFCLSTLATHWHWTTSLCLVCYTAIVSPERNHSTVTQAKRYAKTVVRE